MGQMHLSAEEHLFSRPYASAWNHHVAGKVLSYLGQYRPFIILLLLLLTAISFVWNHHAVGQRKGVVTARDMEKAFQKERKRDTQSYLQVIINTSVITIIDFF